MDNFEFESSQISIAMKEGPRKIYFKIRDGFFLLSLIVILPNPINPAVS